MRSPNRAGCHPAVLEPCTDTDKLVLPELPAWNVIRIPPHGREGADGRASPITIATTTYDSAFEVTDHLKLTDAQEATIANGMVWRVGPWSSRNGKEYKSETQRDGSHWVIRMAENESVHVLSVKGSETNIAVEVFRDGNFRKLQEKSA